MALGKKLKDLLDDNKITVKEFAQNIGVAPTTLYSFIKRDSDTGKLDLINKISNGLGMSIEDFLQLDYEVCLFYQVFIHCLMYFHNKIHYLFHIKHLF